MGKLDVESNNGYSDAKKRFQQSGSSFVVCFEEIKEYLHRSLPPRLKQTSTHFMSFRPISNACSVKRRGVLANPLKKAIAPILPLKKDFGFGRLYSGAKSDRCLTSVFPVCSHNVRELVATKIKYPKPEVSTKVQYISNAAVTSPQVL